MLNISEIPYIEVEFDKDGESLSAESVQLPAGTTDAFVISHGWNNDKADARGLYQELFGNMASELKALQKSTGRRFAIVGVFWPSKKFDFTVAVQADAEGSATASAAKATTDPVGEASARKKLEELVAFLRLDKLPENGSAGMTELEGAAAVANKQLRDLDAKTSARKLFVEAVRSLVDGAAAHEDDASDDFFARPGDVILGNLILDEDDLSFEVLPAGGAASIQHGAALSESVGGKAGIVSFFKGFSAAAVNVLNYTTYYEMKRRAGIVGQNGVAEMIDALNVERIHLVGHSFGGRVVAAAAASSQTRNINSLTLLQAAFSHNGFSKSKGGFFRSIVESGRVKGPILITYTANDKAVGLAYPIASRMNRDSTAALGDKNDKYGGIGRNGAQHMGVDEISGGEKLLKAVEETYAFTKHIFNLEASKYITDHGAVRGPQVAHAIFSAIQ